MNRFQHEVARMTDDEIGAQIKRLKRSIPNDQAMLAQLRRIQRARNAKAKKARASCKTDAGVLQDTRPR